MSLLAVCTLSNLTVPYPSTISEKAILTTLRWRWTKNLRWHKRLRRRPFQSLNWQICWWQGLQLWHIKYRNNSKVTVIFASLGQDPPFPRWLSWLPVRCRTSQFYTPPQSLNIKPTLARSAVRPDAASAAPRSSVGWVSYAGEQHFTTLSWTISWGRRGILMPFHLLELKIAGWMVGMLRYLIPPINLPAKMMVFISFSTTHTDFCIKPCQYQTVDYR